jgi:hypothetical protein
LAVNTQNNNAPFNTYLLVSICVLGSLSFSCVLSLLINVNDLNENQFI